MSKVKFLLSKLILGVFVLTFFIITGSKVQASTLENTDLNHQSVKINANELENSSGYLEKDIYDDAGEYIGTISIEHIESKTNNSVSTYSYYYGGAHYRNGGVNRIHFSDGLNNLGFDMIIKAGPRVTNAINPTYAWRAYKVHKYTLTNSSSTATLTLHGTNFSGSSTKSLSASVRKNKDIYIDVY